jgi:prostaglandin-H2 D-isomerase / glutathione transferase
MYASRPDEPDARIRMTKPRLTYFDFAGSRGEECRMALHLAGVDFEDVRVQASDWPAMKPSMPFGAMPVLEIPGKPPVAHSNAILVLIGREHGLHPAEAFEAARHEALMCAVEELRHTITPTLRISDPEQKRKAREALAANELNVWGSQVERQLGDGPFVGGAKLQVADLKLYMIVRWLTSGTLDHVPTTVLDHCPKLLRLFRAVGEHAGVKDWQAKSKR